MIYLVHFDNRAEKVSINPEKILHITRTTKFSVCRVKSLPPLLLHVIIHCHFISDCIFSNRRRELENHGLAACGRMAKVLCGIKNLWGGGYIRFADEGLLLCGSLGDTLCSGVSWML